MTAPRTTQEFEEIYGSGIRKLSDNQLRAEEAYFNSKANDTSERIIAAKKVLAAEMKRRGMEQVGGQA